MCPFISNSSEDIVPLGDSRSRSPVVGRKFVQVRVDGLVKVVMSGIDVSEVSSLVCCLPHSKDFLPGFRRLDDVGEVPWSCCSNDVQAMLEVVPQILMCRTF